jgi:predicted PurR-regulated permease PerM
MSARFNPASGTTLLLRQSIDLNVMSLFNRQLDYFKDQIDKHKDLTKTTIDKISTLSLTKTDIQLTRSNLVNLASNQKGFVGSAKNKAIEKWVFFSFFITHIIALAVIYFFLRNNQSLAQKTFSYFILYSGVWLLVLSIYAVVLASKHITL